jgi:3-hydroxybutyryl-CoA dehydrogenase
MLLKLSNHFPRATVTFGKSFSAANVKKLSIIGAGQMGTGIGIVAAVTGKIEHVQMLDSTQASLEKSKVFLNGWLDKEIKKGRLTGADKTDVLSRISYADKLQAAKDSHFIIEAVNEDFALKKKIFSTLDSITAPDTILASNTSSISITKIASTTKRPSKVIGMHYFNPVPVMKGVELITALQTSEETIQTTKE